PEYEAAMSSVPGAEVEPEDEEEDEAAEVEAETESEAAPADEDGEHSTRGALRHGWWWGWAIPAPPTPATGTTSARWCSMCSPARCRARSPRTRHVPQCWTVGSVSAPAGPPARGWCLPSRAAT